LHEGHWAFVAACAGSAASPSVMSRFTYGTLVDIRSAMPLLSILTCSCRYSMKGVLVQHPNFMMVVTLAPFWNKAMAPLAHKEWELTSFGL